VGTVVVARGVARRVGTVVVARGVAAPRRCGARRAGFVAATGFFACARFAAGATVRAGVTEWDGVTVGRCVGGLRATVDATARVGGTTRTVDGSAAAATGGADAGRLSHA
jgi:hypothetical protein